MAEEIPMDWAGASLAWRSRGRYSVSSTECRADRPGHSLLFIARYLEEIRQERLIQAGSHLSLTYHSRFIKTNLLLGMFLPSCLSLCEICHASVYWFIDYVCPVATAISIAMLLLVYLSWFGCLKGSSVAVPCRVETKERWKTSFMSVHACGKLRMFIVYCQCSNLVEP